MKEIKTEIEIEAQPEVVWRALTEFASYGEWNPFIRSIEGGLRAGGKLTVRIEPPDGKAMRFTPRVLAVEPNRELRWKGRLLVPGLFDGEHSLRVEPLEGGRSRFVHSERFTGLLVPLFGGALDKTAAGFAQMNEALKTRAEAAV